MEEFARRLVHKKRLKTERRPTPSETFAEHFEKDHGVDLLPQRVTGTNRCRSLERTAKEHPVCLVG